MHERTLRRSLLALAVALGIANPAVLPAQICAGFPTTTGEAAVAASMGFPAEATALALEASRVEILRLPTKDESAAS